MNLLPSFQASWNKHVSYEASPLTVYESSHKDRIGTAVSSVSQGRAVSQRVKRKSSESSGYIAQMSNGALSEIALKEFHVP